jgi:hypothetical protein
MGRVRLCVGIVVMLLLRMTACGSAASSPAQVASASSLALTVANPASSALAATTSHTPSPAPTASATPTPPSLTPGVLPGHETRTAVPTPARTGTPTPFPTTSTTPLPPSPTPTETWTPSPYRYLPMGPSQPDLSQPCPGCPRAPGYIVGHVVDAGGIPLAGVRLVCYNDWHRYPVVGSKGGGEYDFPILQAEATWYVVVLDEADQPISPEAPVHFNPLEACWYRLDWQRID